MNSSEGLKSFHQSLYDLPQWVSADCAAGPLVPAGITGINVEGDHGSHVHLVVRDAEGRMVCRPWNFEPDAGEDLNRYNCRSDILTDIITR